MKQRWLIFFSCAAGGLVLLAGGLLIPAHLRALDAAVLQCAGRNSRSLADEEQALGGVNRLGTAQMLQQAAVSQKIAGAAPAGASLATRVQQNAGASFWGVDGRTKTIFGGGFRPTDQGLAFTDFVVRQENREAALAHLNRSPNAAVQELMRNRSLQDTMIFSPSSSASGQAFDAAVATGGLLLEGGCLTTGLSGEILNLATSANHGNGSRPIEEVLLDFTSLGQRMNWDQLTAFVVRVPDVETLHRLVDQSRNAGERLPVLFAAVELSGRPVAVSDYLTKFSQTGWTDLSATLQYGAGGVTELVRRQQRVYAPELMHRLAGYDPFGSHYAAMAKLSFRQPELALTLKWFLYLAAGFLLALALHFVRRPATVLERPLQTGSFHLFREFLFALGFLLVVLLGSEPFLAQDSQRVSLTLRLLPPTTGGAVTAGIASIKQSIMNPTILLTLLVFLVLQVLIYVSCLVKLAEIRRQNIPARMKLKLLENEDHLFDAGLYIGFVGTIVSLIVASMGLVKFSLMAAYSSTSFGIIFVVIFKIFHLRPARRTLLLEAEAQSPTAETQVPAGTPAATQPS